MAKFVLIIFYVLLYSLNLKAIDFKAKQYSIDETCRYTVTKNKNNLSEVRIDFKKEASKESSFKTGYDIFYFDYENQEIKNADKTYCPSRVEAFKYLDSRYVEIIVKCGGLMNGQSKTTVHIYDSALEKFIFSYVHRKAAIKFTSDPQDHAHTGPIKTTTDHFWCLDEKMESLTFMKYYKSDLIPDNVKRQLDQKIVKSRIKQASLFPEQNMTNSNKTKSER